VARKGPDVCTTWCVRVGTAKRGKEGTGCLHHLVRACGDRLAVPAVVTVVAAQGASGSGVGASFSTGASLQMRVCRVVRARARHACDACVHGRCPIPPAVIVARGCLYYGTGIANSPCSWCAGHMSPPRLPPGGRRHLLPGHLHHRRTVAGAGVRVVRARARHVCDSCASPAAYAPSRARRLCRADARSSGEGAARPPLCADEAGVGELVGPGASRLLAPLFVACGCLYSGTGIANSPCSWGAVLVEVSGPRSHRRRRHTACRRGNWKFARRARLAKRDSSVQHNTQ
jgi:hypothetical protein